MTPDDAARGEKIALSGKYSSRNGGAYADEPPPDDDPSYSRLNNLPPDGEHQDDGTHEEGPDLTTWEAIDLGPWLAGGIQQPHPDTGIVRTDGQRILYPGREHAVLGETESGKSWLALGCVAAELAAGHRVLYIHYEESEPASTIERLQLLGITPDSMTERLRFVGPSRPVRAGWLAALLVPAPTLVVHDGVNEGMSLHGADIMAADGASKFRRNLILPCLRAGAATLSCDHVPKNVEGRGRDAYGSVHKGNAIDGARIVLENVKPFGRGMRGVSYVFISKDRPGQLRAHGKPTKQPGKTFYGTLVVDADLTGTADFRLSFFAPKDDDAETVNPVNDLADTVYTVIDTLPGGVVASMRLLYAEVRKAGHEMRDSAVRSAVDDLLVAGRLVEVPGKRSARGYKTEAKPGTATEAQT